MSGARRTDGRSDTRGERREERHWSRRSWRIWRAPARAAALALCLGAALAMLQDGGRSGGGAWAQSDAPGTGGPGAGRDGDQDGDADTRSGIERFADEVIEPKMRDSIERFLGLIQPWLNRLAAGLEDLPQYEAPVVLPNGDILIRRKRETPPEARPADPSGDQDVLDL